MLSLRPTLDRGRPLRVLALGAHADDIEIGCGGTVLRLCQALEEVSMRWVVLGAEGTRAEEADRSAAAFAASVASPDVDVCGFRDSFFPSARGELKEFFERLKSEPAPDLVLTHTRHDLHQDHRVVNELTWNTFRDHAILEYEVPKYDGDLGQPNVFVPLAQDVCLRKAELLLEHFGSQRGPALVHDRSLSLASAPSRCRMRVIDRLRRGLPRPEGCDHGVTTALDVVDADIAAIVDECRSELEAIAGRHLLITGGAGFLGYYLVQAPLRFNDECSATERISVTVYDNYARGVPGWLDGLAARDDLDLVRHDVREPLPAEAANADFIIHAAGIASPIYYRQHPIETNGRERSWDSGRSGALARERAESGRPVERLLFFSSSEIYGDPAPEAIPTPETYRGNVSCTGPRACYDESKRYGETLCVNFARQHDVRVTMARPFNNYGPGLKISDRPRSPCSTSPRDSRFLPRRSGREGHRAALRWQGHTDVLLRGRCRQRVPEDARAGTTRRAVQRRSRSRWGSPEVSMLRYRVVVVKSTVMPGTTDLVVLGELERASGKRAGSDFGVCVNPEFLTEGRAISDFMESDRIVIGAIDERSAEVLEQLYAGLAQAPIVRTTTRTAEVIKVASNALLAASISFANEIANLCSAVGDADVAEVMRGVHLMREFGAPRAARAPLTSFLEAGCGFGGSCLPKDVRSLAAHGKRLGQATPLLGAVVEVNAGRAAELVARLKRHLPS